TTEVQYPTCTYKYAVQTRSTITGLNPQLAHPLIRKQRERRPHLSVVAGSIVRRSDLAPAGLSRRKVSVRQAFLGSREIPVPRTHWDSARVPGRTGRSGYSSSFYSHAGARRKNRRKRDRPAAALAQTGKIIEISRN